MPTTTTTTQSPWLQPYGEGYVDAAWNNANTAYTPYQGEQVAGFNPWQTAALDAQANRATDGSATMNAAQNYVQQGLAAPTATATVNPYATANNPYLTQSIDNAQGDVVRNWNSVAKPQWDTKMAGSGSFGNAGVAMANQQAGSDMQQNLGRISTDMRMGAYNEAGRLRESFAGRNDAMRNADGARRLQMAGLAPEFAASDYADIDKLMAAGNAYQKQDQAVLNQDYTNYLESRDWKKNQLADFGKTFGVVSGNNSQTNAQGDAQNPLATGLGGALTAAQIYEMLFGGENGP